MCVAPKEKHDMRPPIVAGDVILRPIGQALAAKLAAGDLTSVAAGDGWPHQDTADALRLAARGAGLCWLVIMDGQVIGDCGTHGPVGRAESVEIGYGLAAPYRGRGYGHQVVSALVGWLVSQAEVAEVIAHTDLGNIPSRRVLERAGFRLTGEQDGEYRYLLRSRNARD